MPLLPYALATVDEAKAYLKITGSAEDAALEFLLNAATLAIEKFCQTAFVIRSITEQQLEQNRLRGDRLHGIADWRLPGSKLLFLDRYPIVSVTSITDDAGNVIGATEFAVWKDYGVLEHVSVWPRPLASTNAPGRWAVVYSAGRFATTADVGADLKLAALMLVALRRASKIPGVQSKSVGDLSITWANGGGGADGVGFPEDVAEMLWPYKARAA